MKCTMMHRIRGQSNIYEVYEDQIANLFHNILKIVYLIHFLLLLLLLCVCKEGFFWERVGFIISNLQVH